MPEPDDHPLLQEFAQSGSEAAFAVLVERYVNLVYSTALRSTANPSDAEEITQAVFIILARKAGKLSSRAILSGWLYQTTRLTAANFKKGEGRRQRREQEAYMQSTLNESAPAWEQLAPLLDEAMGRLGETDRTAIVLHYFEKKTAAEVALALRTTEAAVYKRTHRALEKLKLFFAKRGVDSTATSIAEVISANSIQLAPAALAKSVTALAVTKGAAASISTLTLIKGALKVMAWTKMKTAVAAGVVLILAAGTTMIVHHSNRHRIAGPSSGIANPTPSQENIERVSEARQWALEFILYAEDHQNQLPANFNQLKSYAPKQGQADSTNWEIVAHGKLQDIHNPSQTILLREKEPVPTSDGKYSRAYAFADGHSQIVASPDPDFTTVEQKRGFVIQSP